MKLNECTVAVLFFISIVSIRGDEKSKVTKYFEEQLKDYMKNIGKGFKKYQNDTRLEQIEKEFSNSNDTIAMYAAIFEKIPEIKKAAEEEKMKLVGRVRHLYKQLAKPNITEAERHDILLKISANEPFVADLPASFGVADVQRILDIHMKHIDTTEDRVYHLERLEERIRELKSILNGTATADEVREAHRNSKVNDKNYFYAPTNKAMLEAVWQAEEMDGEFNAKTFFASHDLDGDGKLGIDEIESFLLELFLKSKGTATTKKVRHRAVKMRQGLMKRLDRDGDGQLSLEEFKNAPDSSNGGGSAETLKEADADDAKDEEELYGLDGIPQYAKLRERLIQLKPTDDDPEALAEWELARRELVEVYTKLNQNGVPSY